MNDKPDTQPQFYWEDEFDNYPSARDWLSNKLTVAVVVGPLRDAGIAFDFDFDRQEGRWKAWVRVVPIKREGPKIPVFASIGATTVIHNE